MWEWRTRKFKVLHLLFKPSFLQSYWFIYSLTEKKMRLCRGWWIRFPPGLRWSPIIVRHDSGDNNSKTCWDFSKSTNHMFLFLLYIQQRNLDVWLASQWKSEFSFAFFFFFGDDYFSCWTLLHHPYLPLLAYKKNK